MNTNLLAALLLPFATATLSAQDLKLEPVAATHGFEFAVHGAAADAMVVLVLGLHTAAIRLPGGQVLGVEPDLVVLAIADGRGPTIFADRLPPEIADAVCLVQAAAVAPRLPIDAPGGITLSAVRRL